MKYYSIQSGRKGFADIQPEIRSAIEHEMTKVNRIFPEFKEVVRNMDLGICFDPDGTSRYDPDLRMIYLDVEGIQTALVCEIVRALDEHYSSTQGVLFSFAVFEGKSVKEFDEAGHSKIQAIQSKFARAVSYAVFSSEKFQLTTLQKARLVNLEKDRNVIHYKKEGIHKIFLNLLREIYRRNSV